MSLLRLLPLALLALGPTLDAQTLPSAGSQLQQIPPAPVPPRAEPTIRIVPSATEAAAAATGGEKVTVARLQITGASVFRESELVAIAGFQPGVALSLGELRALAARITEHYRSAGYFLAQAYLPAQDIRDGVVTIDVLEGRYGKVVVRNRARLADRVVDAPLAGLDAGAPITIAPLESRLLRLSDIPGVAVTSTLAPGSRLGESDLIVDVAPGPLVSGSVDADNGGNRYTGEYRVGATVNLNNAAGQGDLASLRLLTSGAGLRYGRLSYQMPFGRATVGVAFSALHYRLGREFESLDASGTATVASLYGSLAVERSRRSNLSLYASLDEKAFRDRVGATSSVADKKAHAVTAGLHGDRVDTFGGSGFTTYGVAGTVGRIDIRTASLREQDAATARSNGGFAKLAFNVARVQGVTDSVSLYAALSGQAASRNLDVSEKMALGGVNAVRAYPEGEAFADEGVLLTLEARKRLPPIAPIPAHLQLIGFVDVGSVRTNDRPWVEGDNSRTLSGAGVGLIASHADGWVAKVSYARRLGSEKVRSAPDAAGRVWVQVIKYF